MPILAWLRNLRSQWLALREFENTPLQEIHAWSGIAPASPLFESLVVFEQYDLNSLLRQKGGHRERTSVVTVPTQPEKA